MAAGQPTWPRCSVPGSGRMTLYPYTPIPLYPIPLYLYTHPSIRLHNPPDHPVNLGHDIHLLCKSVIGDSEMHAFFVAQLAKGGLSSVTDDGELVYRRVGEAVSEVYIEQLAIHDIAENVLSAQCFNGAFVDKASADGVTCRVVIYCKRSFVQSFICACERKYRLQIFPRINAEIALAVWPAVVAAFLDDVDPFRVQKGCRAGYRTGRSCCCDLAGRCA